MWFKTPRAKVYGYRAIVGMQYGAAVMLGALGFPHVINPFIGGIGIMLLLVTAFASSKTDLAKEVKKIVQFINDGHPWDQYPATDEDRDALRRELYPQLVFVAEMMIWYFREAKKFKATDDLLGRKAANVNYANAKNAFYQRWSVYKSIDILPLKNEGEPCKSPTEFFRELQQRMKLQKQRKNRVCA
jgi:hypothetical protein